MDKLSTGIDLYLSGDLHNAIKVFKEHIAEKGFDIGSAYYHLGLCFSDLNMQAEAGENFIKAVEYSPEKSMYHYKLGLAYFRLMALDKAASSLEKTLQLNPEHQRSRFLLGQVYFQQGAMDKAYNIFSEVLRKSPDFADAYYFRGRSLYQQGKDVEALSDLYKALEINDEHMDALIEISKIYFQNADYEKSYTVRKKIYNKGLRSFPFMKNYLIVLKNVGKFDEFNQIKQEAAVLFPNNQELESL